MRSLRALFPQVAARRVWAWDGTPAWEFRFTPRPRPVEVPDVDPPTASGPGRDQVRFVTSRGVDISGNILRIDQFHHRIRMPVGRPADHPENPDVQPAPVELAGHPDVEPAPVELAGHPDVEPALVELAAHPEDESAQHRVIDRLEGAHGWLRSVPVLDVSAAWITGEGLGHSLDGVFVWRAEGTRALTYLVAPDPGTRDLLAADPDLVQALVRAACPHPEDALGDLESSLREAITRVGVANPARIRATSATELVLRVEPSSPERSEPTGQSVIREKSEAERALSAELAELARKVGAASVRKPPVGHAGHALEAG